MKTVLTTIIALFAFAPLFSFEAYAKELQHEKTVWLAKLTEQRQCGQGSQPSLGRALDALEHSSQVHIKVAMVALLSDRAQCLSCNCPAGTYYVAQITNPSQEQIDSIVSNDWELIDENKVTQNSLKNSLGNSPSNGPSKEPSYNVLPVVPSI